MCHRQGLRCWSHVSGSLSTYTISGFFDCLASILHLSITIRIWCNARFLYFQYMAKRTEQPWFKIAASVGVNGTMSGFFDCLANILHLSITIRIWCNTGFLYFQYLAQRTEQPWFKIAASVGVNGIRRHYIGEPTELSTNALAQVLARRLGKVYDVHLSRESTHCQSSSPSTQWSANRYKRLSHQWRVVRPLGLIKSQSMWSMWLFACYLAIVNVYY